MTEGKVVKWGFEGTVFKLAVDANKDGEPSIKLEVDLGEGAQEAIDAFTKKKDA